MQVPPIDLGLEELDNPRSRRYGAIPSGPLHQSEIPIHFQLAKHTFDHESDLLINDLGNVYVLTLAHAQFSLSRVTDAGNTTPVLTDHPVSDGLRPYRGVVSNQYLVLFSRVTAETEHLSVYSLQSKGLVAEHTIRKHHLVSLVMLAGVDRCLMMFRKFESALSSHLTVHELVFDLLGKPASEYLRVVIEKVELFDSTGEHRLNVVQLLASAERLLFLSVPHKQERSASKARVTVKRMPTEGEVLGTDFSAYAELNAPDFHIPVRGTRMVSVVDAPSHNLAYICFPDYNPDNLYILNIYSLIGEPLRATTYELSQEPSLLRKPAGNLLITNLGHPMSSTRSTVIELSRPTEKRPANVAF